MVRWPAGPHGWPLVLRQNVQLPARPGLTPPPPAIMTGLSAAAMLGKALLASPLADCFSIPPVGGIYYSEFNHWCFSTDRFVKKRQPIQHIDVIECSSSHFQNRRARTWFLHCCSWQLLPKLQFLEPHPYAERNSIPFQAEAQFFHSQCKQAMEPIHSGNPAASTLSISLLMLSNPGF